MKKHMEDFGMHVYDLPSCASCNRYVWPNDVTTGEECPLCHSTCKITVNYVPTTSYTTLMFAGNENFCKEFANFQHEIARTLQSPSKISTDWYDGEVGRSMLKIFDYKSTIFCGIGFDGLNKSKSSILDAWPVIMKIMSLPLSIRNDPQYMFMSSMTTYTSKPSDIDNSLIPVLEELEYLSTHSVPMYNMVTKSIQSYHFCLLTVSCDLDAWFKAFCRTHWKSKCACYIGKCNAAIVPDGKNKLNRDKYRTDWNVMSSELRTGAQLIASGVTALNTGKVTNGMKRVPVFAIISYFDMVKSSVIDLMHLYFVHGIFLVLLSGTYDAAGKQMESQIKAASQNLAVQMTHEHKRNYRSLEYIDKMKAEEVMNYTQFFIMIILCNINGLKRCFVEIWRTAANKIRIAQLTSDLNSQIVAHLSSKKVTFKVHNSRHIPKCIDYNGPLRHGWCFPLENLLSFVRAMIFGRLEVDKALYFSVRMYSSLEAIESFNNTKLKNPTDIIYSVNNEKGITCRDQLDRKAICMMLGKPNVTHSFSLHTLQSFFSSSVTNISDVSVFKRAKINGAVYHSLMYSRAIRRQSVFVEVWLPNDKRLDAPNGIDSRSHIAVVEAYFMYKQYGYACIRMIDDIGIHSLGNFRMISQHTNSNLHMVALTQIRRKGHLVSVNAVNTSYAVLPTSIEEGRRSAPYRVFC